MRVTSRFAPKTFPTKLFPPSRLVGLVRPDLEYSGSIWDPSGVGLQNELEKVQNRVARFVTGNYNFETVSMTGT